MGADGALFVSVWLTLSEALSPEGSVTVTLHEISSLRDAKLLSKVSVAEDPSEVPVVALVHVYDSVNVSLSASLAVTLHVSKLSLYDVVGDMLSEEIVGVVLEATAEAVSEVLAP